MLNRAEGGPIAGMKSGRPKVELVLSREEREVLEGLTRRRKTAAGLARRAAIVLACAQGVSNQVVAGRLQVAPSPLGNGVGDLYWIGWTDCWMNHDPGPRAR